MTCPICDDEPDARFFDGPPDPQTPLILCPECSPTSYARQNLVLIAVAVVSALLAWEALR